MIKEDSLRLVSFERNLLSDDMDVQDQIAPKQSHR